MAESLANRRRNISNATAERGFGRLLLDSVSETVLNVAFFFLGFIGFLIRWSLATLFFLGVMAGAGYFVFTNALDGGQHVTVPNIVDLPITEASFLLAEQGLDLGKQTQVPHESVPKYHVITQRPPAGKVVRTGRKVYATVSLGADYQPAPDLVKKALNDARRELAQARLRVGSVARVAHRTPRDTVIAQDPPPGRNLSRTGTVSLLVSAGDQKATAFMPDIRGKLVDELPDLLAPYGVILVPNVVNYPGAQEDVVLNQDPPADTLIYEGQMVTYDVKPSGQAAVPTDQHEAVIRHKMPYDWYDRDTQIVFIDAAGNRETIKSYPPQYEEEARQTRIAGSVLRIPVTYIGDAAVEIYINNELVETYFLKSGGEPAPASDSVP